MGSARRRCRVALLPDCHIGSLSHAPPSHPQRRLYGAARQLLEEAVRRLPAMDVDAALLLGDTLDPADPTNLHWLREFIDHAPLPIHTVIGNHETYGPITAGTFHRTLGLPESGDYVAWVRDVPFVMLATPDQGGLAQGSRQLRFLEQTLEQLATEPAVFCCAHFSLLLHPCVQGSRNDGMQVLWTAEAVLELLARFPNVRAWIAGHKNIPSRLEFAHTLHLLSPQLIQAPCAFRVLDILDGGIASHVHPIEQQHLAQWSRLAYGAAYADRCGRKEDRDFVWRFADG